MKEVVMAGNGNAVFDIASAEAEGKIITVESWQTKKAWLQDVQERKALREKQAKRDALNQKRKQEREMVIDVICSCIFCACVLLILGFAPIFF